MHPVHPLAQSVLDAIDQGYEQEDRAAEEDMRIDGKHPVVLELADPRGFRRVLLRHLRNVERADGLSQ